MLPSELPGPGNLNDTTLDQFQQLDEQIKQFYSAKSVENPIVKRNVPKLNTKMLMKFQTKLQFKSNN